MCTGSYGGHKSTLGVILQAPSAMFFKNIILFVNTLWHMCGGQKTAYRSWCLPSAMWIIGNKTGPRVIQEVSALAC